MSEIYCMTYRGTAEAVNVSRLNDRRYIDQLRDYELLDHSSEYLYQDVKSYKSMNK
jgi:response regulator of citrate/malate metabolism